MHALLRMSWATSLALLMLHPLPASTAHAFSVGATWGQLISSQLDSERPVSFWSVHMHAPLVEAVGLTTKMRFDSIVFGEPGNLLSLAVHPGRTEYNLAVRVQPPGSPIGFEAHHVSSHAVAILHNGSRSDFEEDINTGGASNFLSLIAERRGVTARVGLGSLWVDTNTAPILLGQDGFLLNSRSSRGPFGSVQVPLPVSGQLRGHAGILYVHDRSGDDRDGYDYMAWGASLFHPLGHRADLGASYSGNNGTPHLKRGNNSISVFLKLRWGLQ